MDTLCPDQSPGTHRLGYTAHNLEEFWIVTFSMHCITTVFDYQL